MRSIPFRIMSIFLPVFFCQQAQAQQSDINQAAQEIVEQLVGQLDGLGIEAIAIPPLANDRDEVTRLSILAADTLAEHFVMIPDGPRVIDRGALNAIQQELSLRTDGFVDASDAAAVGRAAGVDALLLGRIIETGAVTRIAVRIVSVSNAEIVAAASATFESRGSGLNVPVTDPGQRTGSGRVYNDAGLIWVMVDVTYSTCPRGVTRYRGMQVNVCARVVLTLENQSADNVRAIRLSDFIVATDREGNQCNGGDVEGLPSGYDSAIDFPAGSSATVQVINVYCTNRLHPGAFWNLQYERAFDLQDMSTEVSASFEY